MKTSRQHDIAFVGLKNGPHEFHFDIDDDFFKTYASPDFQDSRLHVRLTLDKENGFFLLTFEITGAVTVHCDRCGDPFVMDIWDEFRLVVKLVEDPEAVGRDKHGDDDPDVVYLSRHESLLKTADWIYEFALLSSPMQRVHGTDAQGKSQCNPAALQRLAGMQGEEGEQANPIWKDLEKFKDL